MSPVIEKVCPICKSVFIPTVQWVYVRGALSREKYFCRYSCMRKYDLNRKAHPGCVEKRMQANRARIEKYLDEGLTPVQIARSMGISESSAKRYIEQIEIDRDGRTRKESIRPAKGTPRPGERIRTRKASSPKANGIRTNEMNREENSHADPR